MKALGLAREWIDGIGLDMRGSGGSRERGRVRRRRTAVSEVVGVEEAWLRDGSNYNVFLGCRRQLRDGVRVCRECGWGPSL